MGLISSIKSGLATVGRFAGFAGGDTQYDSASRKGSLKNWDTYAGSADGDLINELPEIISRARDADRNQPLANATISSLVYNVVGKGLTVVPDPDYHALGKTKEWADEWSQVVQSEALSYFNSSDVDATGIDDHGHLTAQVFESSLMNGGVVALPIWRTEVAAHRATDYQTAFKLVEIDRLCNPDDGMDTDTLRGGVELDADGEPIAYHLLKAHPGDLFTSGGFKREWERIPAYTPWGRARALHIFSRDRIGANRGTPLLANVLTEYKTMDTAIKAELDSVVANAMVALIAESPMPADMIRDIFGTPENYMAMRGEFKARLKSGSLVGLFPGDKLTSFSSNRPNSNFGPFIDYIARGSAAVTGQPLELIRRDYAKMNYSGMRGMMIDVGRTFATHQSWLARRWGNPGYQLFLEEAVDKGRVPDCTIDDLYENWTAWTRCEWLGQGAGWVDPVKEADAAHNRVVYSFSSLKDECAIQGKDWRKIADQKATERAYYKKLGEPYPGDEVTLTPSELAPPAADAFTGAPDAQP